MSALKKVLIASIALNVVTLGVIGGHLVTREMRGAPPHRMMYAVIDSLPEAQQEKARAEYKKASNDNRANFKAEAAARKRYFEVLRAKEFDEKALEEAGSKLHVLRGAMIARMQEATKAIAKDLPYEDRVRMADTLERMFMRSSKNKSPKPPHGDARGPEGHRPPPPRD